MIRYMLLALIVGGGLGYFIAYTKYGNVEMIEELRSNYKELQQKYTSQQVDHRDVDEQNRILKQQAQMLLHQNEDYSKMVSELSRYYYRIKQGSAKLKELADIMGIYDEKMEAKLNRVMGEDLPFEGTEIPTQDEDEKYF